MTKLYFFFVDQNLFFLLIKILFFDQNFDFLSKFRFFDQNFDFCWPNLFFYLNLIFRPKLRLFYQIAIFLTKLSLTKNQNGVKPKLFTEIQNFRRKSEFEIIFYPEFEWLVHLRIAESALGEKRPLRFWPLGSFRPSCGVR